MAAKLEQIVTKVVTQALEGHVAQVRDELVQRVMEAIKPQLSAGDGASGGGAADLLQAVAAIQAGGTQREILRSLLDSLAKYSGRSSLFVVKGGAATGWQGRGFADNDAVKDFQLDVSDGAAAKALQTRAVITGKSSEMGKAFVSQFHAPKHDQVIVLPLLLKDKVAALVYADAGESSLDTAAIEVLVLSTSAWLEVASLRKLTQKDGQDSAPVERAEAAAAASQAAPTVSDPFAAHAPKHAMAAAAPASQPQTVASVAAESPVDGPAPATADPFVGMSPEDADLHRKAQRFARLLVDEIKLYNQVKVSEGRKHKDLYDRLKEDVEKSRGTYQKRYGNTAAASADYFSQEVIRSLAEDDVSILGANFRR